MIELIFVIVVIGILVGVALPRLLSPLDDANTAKSKDVISAVRNAVISYRQEGILKGEMSYPSKLDDATAGNENEVLFDGNSSAILLKYPVYSKSSTGGWMKVSDSNYTYNFSGISIPFEYNSALGTFDCNQNDNDCQKLTR